MSLILPSATDRLEDMGFRTRGRIRDNDGIVGMWLSLGVEHYVLVAKKYAHENKASFITRAVEAANEGNMYLIFYRSDEMEYTVFDQRIVKQHGNDSEGPSKKGPATWRELSLRYGVGLPEHLDGSDPFYEHEMNDLSDEVLDQWT